MDRPLYDAQGKPQGSIVRYDTVAKVGTFWLLGISLTFVGAFTLWGVGAALLATGIYFGVSATFWDLADQLSATITWVTEKVG